MTRRSDQLDVGEWGQLLGFWYLSGDFGFRKIFRSTVAEAVPAAGDAPSSSSVPLALSAFLPEKRSSQKPHL